MPGARRQLVLLRLLSRIWKARNGIRMHHRTDDGPMGRRYFAVIEFRRKIFRRRRVIDREHNTATAGSADAVMMTNAYRQEAKVGQSHGAACRKVRK